jgi:S-adenosylmethionine:tRNA ribosyltransferase-isomerase
MTTASFDLPPLEEAAEPLPLIKEAAEPNPAIKEAAEPLPPINEASEPPEARGARRDDVRLLISYPDGHLDHLRFASFPLALERGDLVVVNTSATLNASIPGTRTFGMRVELHLSTELRGGLWVVEVRQHDPAGSKPLRVAMAGEVVTLPAGGRAAILSPYPFASDLFAGSRLWLAALELPKPLLQYLDEHGEPIRYRYVAKRWPLSYYQTIFASEPGSAEMPSAGRPFTHEIVEQLGRRGIGIAPIVLHTGVSSLEDHEPPYEERFRVSKETADRVNRAHAEDHRVIAVGTTVVRALETVTDDRGVTHPGNGWTDLVINSDRNIHAVDGLLTGFHEPEATHLSMVRAIARRAGDRSGHSIDRAYVEAIERGYRWHEFGDVHLIAPVAPRSAG